MNRVILHIIIVLFPLLLAGQSTRQATIVWSDLISVKSSIGTEINYLTFEGASNIYEFGSLPVYVIDLPLPPEYFGYQVEIESVSWDTLSIEQAERLTDTESLTKKAEFRIRENEKNNKIYILPIYTSDNGKIIRLTNFDVHFDLIPVENTPSLVNSPITYADESVLNSGTWFKMGIINTGIHKITYSDLENFGIDPAQIDPKKLGIFGNYSGMLPEENLKPESMG